MYLTLVMPRAHDRDRYHLNSSSQVVLMPPHMVKGRVEPIS